MRRWLALVAAAFVGGMTLVPLVAEPGGAAGLDGLVTAEAESYALRVQYDIPLPFGPGTIPHTVGEIRRSQAGENSKGLAGAPTHFDAVVGGTYADPDKSQKGDERLPPQVECFYPGDLVNTAFGFPTDTQAETSALPPTSRATARCGAGPEVELHASAGIVELTGITARGIASDTLARPTGGVDRAETAAHADNISIAAGAVTIGSVDISGASRVTGRPGEAATETRATITDVVAGGTRFSIADDRLIVAGQAVPLAGPVAQGIVDQANVALAASQCRIDVITQPTRYPQGFLFSRPTPKLGVEPDGTFAGSMRAGLLVLCDLPEQITGNTDLNPQRIQVVVGFAYTATSAVDEPGGFNIGNLVGSIDVPSVDLAPSFTPSLIPSVGVVTEPAPTTLAPRLPTTRSTPIAVARPRLTDALDSSVRWILAIVCLTAWAVLTHLGIRKLRGITT